MKDSEMKLNQRKTKIMSVADEMWKREVEETAIYVDGMKLEQVNVFQYLEAKIEDAGGQESECFPSYAE